MRVKIPLRSSHIPLTCTMTYFFVLGSLKLVEKLASQHSIKVTSNTLADLLYFTTPTPTEKIRFIGTYCNNNGSGAVTIYP